MTKGSISFSDKDCICYLLTILKDLEKQCCLMMMEASNDWLYQIYRDMLLDISSLERKVYYVLFINNWYLLESVEEIQLKERYKVFFQQYKSLIHG